VDALRRRRSDADADRAQCGRWLWPARNPHVPTGSPRYRPARRAGRDGSQRRSRPDWWGMTRTVAALYVETGGCYFGLPGVDPWDEARDARRYAGPHPVVSHTPCPRWGRMWFGQPLTVKRTGVRKKLGDDGGCFAHSYWAVRQFG